MKVKVFYPEPDGSIRLSKQELQALLDEVYREGYNDAKPYYWSSPYWSNSGTITTTPYITYTTTASNSTANLNSTTTTSATVPSTLTTSNCEAPEPKSYHIEFAAS